MNGNLERFKAMFLDECEEHIRTLEKSLTALQRGGHGQEWIDNAFRAVHSIKGGAGMLGFARIVPFAHTLEAVLDAARLRQIAITEDLATTALRAVDCLSDLILAASKGTDMPAGYEAAHIVALTKAAGIAISAAAPAMATGPAARQDPPDADTPVARCTFHISFKPHQGLLRRANDPLLIFRQLRELGELTVTADPASLPPLHVMAATDAYLSWQLELSTAAGETAVRAVFEFVEDDCDLTIVPAHEVIAPAPTQLFPIQASMELPSGEAALSTIRVDLDRIDRLVNLAGEIAISQALVAQLIDQTLFNANPRMFQELSQLLVHTQNLQDSVMAIRAQPIRTIFERMPRLVRELCEQTGKNIVLRVTGESTEIDKTVIEQLSDPLTHMIRNAADHGLETAAERLAAGKPPEGIITLSAEQRGSRIVIEVGDDGRGINRERVRQQAVARNLIAADATLAPEEIDNLIFLPGFSTAEKVTDLSGRGVGMDVVKRNIQKLGGRVGIRTEPGRGSKMILTLPLTLAVLEGMIVRSGGESYVIPIASIYECRATWMKDTGLVPGFGDVLNVRGTYVTLLHLDRVFNANAPRKDLHHTIAIIAELEGGQQIALVVDEIIGQQQVVIKSITENLNHVPGIAGATILGDGRVALILDPTEIAKLNAVPGQSTQSPEIHPRSKVA
jgi:two-component system, chemotaxis family, sensor kinase CheA